MVAMKKVNPAVYWIGLFVLLIICSAQPLMAGNEKNLHFFSLDYGRSYLNELAVTDNSRISLDHGMVHRLAWGGQVSSLRVEYGLSYRSSDVKRFRNASGLKQSATGSFDRTGVHLDFYGYEDFPDLGSSLTNYWGIGMGVVRYRFNNFEVPGEISVDETDVALVPDFFIGWEWILTDRHRLALQYRYSLHTELDFETQTTGRSLELDNFDESVATLNYRWFY